MFNVLSLGNICEDLNVLQTFLILKNIITVAKFLVPLLLIIMISFDIYKGYVLTGDFKANSKTFKTIGNRLVAALIIFFIPTIIDLVVDIENDDISFNLSECLSVTSTELEAKKLLSKNECTDSNKRWNSNTNTCEVVINTNQTTKRVITTKNNNSNNEENTSGSTTSTIKKIDSLYYYNQVNYPNTPFCYGSATVANSGCGAASFAMITSTYTDPSYDLSYVAKWLCNNGHTSGGLGSSTVLSQKTLDYFNLNVDILFNKLTTVKGYNYGTTYNQTEGDAMLKAVQDGKSVMFGMPGHWSVVGPNSECSSTKFYLYNPSRPSMNGCYTPKELFNATYNYSNRCYNQNWCGWDVAYAFYNR